MEDINAHKPKFGTQKPNSWQIIYLHLTFHASDLKQSRQTLKKLDDFLTVTFSLQSRFSLLKLPTTKTANARKKKYASRRSVFESFSPVYS